MFRNHHKELKFLEALVRSLERGYIDHLWKPVGHEGTHGPWNVTETVKHIIKDSPLEVSLRRLEKALKNHIWGAPGSGRVPHGVPKPGKVTWTLNDGPKTRVVRVRPGVFEAVRASIPAEPHIHGREPMVTGTGAARCVCPYCSDVHKYRDPMSKTSGTGLTAEFGV